MISKRSQFLFLAPLLFGEMVILTTPTVWKRKKDVLVHSKGIWAVNYFNYCVGFSIGHIVVALLNVEAIVSGHATTMEIMTCFFLFPLIVMGVATMTTLIVYWNLGIYVANQVLKTNKKFVKYFGLNRKKKDGAEGIIILSYCLAWALSICSIPSTAFLLYSNPGFFYNMRFETLGMNFILSGVGCIALMGDVIYIVYWVICAYLHLHSNSQYLKLMEWKEGVTNTELATFIRMYRQIRLGHQLLFNNFGGWLIPITHACAGVMMVSFLFNVIYFNLTSDPFFITQMAFCLAIIIVAFKVISKNMCDFTESTSAFLESYNKQNMPELSPANERELKACHPIKVEVKPLLTYERITFVQVMQDVILANVIDLLLGAQEMNLQV